MKDIREELLRCARCGKCRSVCPTFLVTRDETKVARGRVTLLEAIVQGKAVPTRYAREILMSCYRCMRCVDACPSGVRMDRVIQHAREMIAKEMGINRLARFMFRRVLPRRRLYDRFVRAARLMQRVLPKSSSQPLRHLPLLYRGRRYVPRIARRSALQALPELLKGRGNEGRGNMKVSVFAGCLLNYVYPEIAASLMRVLQLHGVDIIFPKSQLCCGAPVLAYGDVEAARTIARRNVECLEADKVDAIVFGCASCSLTMKNDYPVLLPEAKVLAEKAYDISEFVDKFLGYSNLPLNQVVTYHDPCHLRWGQGVAEPPRKIARQSGRYIEMENAGACCGLGGSFSLTHYDVSCTLGEAKAEAIRATGAEVVATACPGCILQLQDQLARKGMSTRVMHVVQLYERSYLEGRVHPLPAESAAISEIAHVE
ncbi:MAG: (Fe-S)-binding protein [Candidatus Aureabacteria bacterium]|nr:(Fe-S)-binding protein [Candidatus Auribacterota bacterium]